MEDRILIHRDRLDGIFECVVQSYVETAMPVGSRMVSERYEGQLSPATIRSVMADLEEQGLLMHPHTSAGRIPTDKGFRYFVDTLVDWDESQWDETPSVANLLREHPNIEDAVENLSHMVADLTQNVALVLLKNVKRVSYLRDIPHQEPSDDELRTDERIYMDGTGYLLSQPEFSDVDKLRDVVRILERKDSLASILNRSADDKKVRIDIGDEVDCENVSNMSVISKAYSFRDNPIGTVGVIGPTRMRYDKTAGVVSRIADEFTEFLNSL